MPENRWILNEVTRDALAEEPAEHPSMIIEWQMCVSVESLTANSASGSG